jgi:general secretion pathway protein C
MISALRRVANAVLFVVACLLAADTANAVFAAIVLPPAAQDAEAKDIEGVKAPTWTDRQDILDRNVFASSTIAPPVEVKSDIDAELEATQLPLTLLGTAASPDPQLAWAAIQERGTRSTLIVGVGGSIQEKATVVRIQRQRVVLLEDGVHRELAFDENSTPQLAMQNAVAAGAPGARRAAMARAAERRQTRLQRLSENSFEMPPDEVQAVMNNPAELLSQARILPKYEEGQMRGVQISQIKPGSLYEQVGLKEGDLISAIDGTPIENPQQISEFYTKFGAGTQISVSGTRSDGQPFTTMLQAGSQ